MNIARHKEKRSALDGLVITCYKIPMQNPNVVARNCQHSDPVRCDLILAFIHGRRAECMDLPAHVVQYYIQERSLHDNSLTYFRSFLRTLNS